MTGLPAGKERQYACAFSYSITGYMLGGINCSNTCLNDFWQYSPITNSWTALPDFPATGRQGMSHFILNDKVYIIGGKYSNGTILNEVWEYNFSNTSWTQKNNLPFSGMWRGAAFAINGTGYICYGFTNAGNYNRSIYQYNQNNDSWQIIPNINLPARDYIGCAVTSNKAFLYGGMDSLYQITNDVHVFDPSNTSINTYTGIPTVGRKGGMAFSLNNIFFITTGVDTSPARIKQTWKNDQFVGMTENRSSDHAFSIYPNPAVDEVKISSDETINEIIITSILGEKVLALSGVSEKIISFNVTSLPEGLYTISLVTANGIYNQKLVVKH
jgi:hypothetical protein